LLRLTREIVVRFAGLLGHVELIEVDILAVEGQGAADLSQVLVEPVNRPDHEVVAIHLGLNVELKHKWSAAYVNVDLLLAIEGYGTLEPVGGIVHGGLLKQLKEEGSLLLRSDGRHVVFSLEDPQEDSHCDRVGLHCLTVFLVSLVDIVTLGKSMAGRGFETELSSTLKAILLARVRCHDSFSSS
jgi:hypothetical protein